MEEEFVPLDPMGMFSAAAAPDQQPSPAANVEAPPPASDEGGGEVAAPGLTSSRGPVADRVADPPQQQAPGLTEQKPSMQGRTLMAYAAQQEAERAKPENIVDLANTSATRSLPITDGLRTNIQSAVTSVYGPGYRAQVYSGGQPGIGSGGARVGSTRHDGGHAADVYILDPNGKRVTGDALAPLAQHWVDQRYGGVGLEMRGGGIHLDTHTDRAAAWDYGNLTPAQAKVINGARGLIPAEAGGARPAPGQQQTGGGIPEEYYGRVRRSESSGDDFAQNRASTATGRYQFTEGTWGDLAKRRPELGLTPEGRTDATQQERAIRAFTEENARTLRSNNLAINGGSLYAAHFLGAGGAVAALKADPNAQMSSIASPEAVKANPFLATMTAGQFRQWAATKGGGGGDDRPMSMTSAGAGPEKRLTPSEWLEQNKEPAKSAASAALGVMRKGSGQGAPGLSGSGQRAQTRSPNALSLDNGNDAELASLDGQIASLQSQAAQDPRAAAALAQLQSRRMSLSTMG